jgi:hypothetical protein
MSAIRPLTTVPTAPRRAIGGRRHRGRDPDADTPDRGSLDRAAA